jgi:hypothetical protein
MVRQAHHERDQKLTTSGQPLTVRPELVEGLVQRVLENIGLWQP